MENASKALLIAASVLIAIVIIGAFMLMMSNLTDYQNKSYQSTQDAQITEFNNLYLSYNRNDVRGSDMISLMNRIVDYNGTKSTEDGFTMMHITINMNGHNSDFSYDGTNRLIISNHYTEDTIDDIVGTPSSITGDISGGKIREIENRYQAKYASQLAAEIANIAAMRSEDEFNQEKILPRSLSSYGVNLAGVYEDALYYYEYVQFKRAKFDCVGTENDRDTGRIISMEFECTGMGV